MKHLGITNREEALLGWTTLLQQKDGRISKKNDRENLDNSERPNTKWVFVKFFNAEVKVVLDTQPLLGMAAIVSLTARSCSQSRSGGAGHFCWQLTGSPHIRLDWITDQTTFIALVSCFVFCGGPFWIFNSARGLLVRGLEPKLRKSLGAFSEPAQTSWILFQTSH